MGIGMIFWVFSSFKIKYFAKLNFGLPFRPPFKTHDIHKHERLDAVWFWRAVVERAESLGSAGAKRQVKKLLFG